VSINLNGSGLSCMSSSSESDSDSSPELYRLAGWLRKGLDVPSLMRRRVISYGRGRGMNGGRDWPESSELESRVKVDKMV